MIQVWFPEKFASQRVSSYFEKINADTFSGIWCNYPYMHYTTDLKYTKPDILSQVLEHS